MVGAKPRNSSAGLFKTLQMLLLPCQYIFPLMNFFVNNQEEFRKNSVLIRGMNIIIFTDQLPSPQAFR